MNSGCAYGFPIDFFFLYVVLKNLTRFRTTLVNYEAELLDGLLENYTPHSEEPVRYVLFFYRL